MQNVSQRQSWQDLLKDWVWRVKEGQDSWFLLERLGDDGAGIGVRRLRAEEFGRRNQELFWKW